MNQPVHSTLITRTAFFTGVCAGQDVYASDRGAALRDCRTQAEAAYAVFSVAPMTLDALRTALAVVSPAAGVLGYLQENFGGQPYW